MYEKLAYIGFASYYLGSIGVECVGSGECYDINGRTISPGFHFVPGPDTCTLCVCDNGNPKWCKAVLCSPPQDCKSFRVGNSCCEFICLDDTFGGGGGGKGGEHDLASEFGLRLIAGAITAILCLSIVFFSIHRLRQRKIRGRQPPLHHHSHLAQVSHHHHHDAASAAGLRFADDRGGPPHYTLWKPLTHAYAVGGLPQEAPPPYEEAVAAAQVEAALAAAAAAAANAAASGGSLQLLHHGGSLHHHHPPSEGHRTIPLTLATSECLFPPTPSHPPPEPQRSATAPQQVAPPHQRAPVAPQPQRATMADVAPVAPPHRNNVDLTPVAPPHRGNVDSAPVAPPHRGNVDLAAVAPHRVVPAVVDGSKVAPLVLPPPPRVARQSVATSTSSCPTVAPQRRTNSNGLSTASVASQVVPPPPPPHPTISPSRADISIKSPSDVTSKPLLPTVANSRRSADNSVANSATRATCGNSAASRLATVVAPHQHHSMAMSSIAEEGQDAEGEEEEEEDDDDYRSECENCNLSVMTDADCFVDDLETMTLHRKPPQDYHNCLGSRQPGGAHAQGGIGEWTSLTLPTNTRTQRPSSVLCNSSQTSARENWFSSMPQTSSESSEEEEEE